LAIPIRSGRGNYLLDLVGDAEMGGDLVVLQLKLEHQGGIERIVFRCRIARVLLESQLAEQPAALVERLAPWIVQEFEQVREAALKSIRTERQPYELSFDRDRAGPF